MDNNPIISIIIPVYNTRPFLRQCLDSVISQSYENLDIIIDDGSGQVCDEYSNNPKVRVYHSSNHGLSAARNLGLDHLDEQCKYVAFFDSDDWMEHDCIQLLYNSAVNNDSDLAVCLFYYEYENKSLRASQIKEKKSLTISIYSMSCLSPIMCVMFSGINYIV